MFLDAPLIVPYYPSYKCFPLVNSPWTPPLSPFPIGSHPCLHPDSSKYKTPGPSCVACSSSLGPSPAINLFVEPVQRVPPSSLPSPARPNSLAWGKLPRVRRSLLDGRVAIGEGAARPPGFPLAQCTLNFFFFFLLLFSIFLKDMKYKNMQITSWKVEKSG